MRAIIPAVRPFDQSTLEQMRDADPVVQRYRARFALFDWSAIDPPRKRGPGYPAHPKGAYLKAALVRINEYLLSTPRWRAHLLEQSVQALQEEIPGLGEVVAYDVKHIYANVKENNWRAYVKERFNKDQQPKGDPDCRMPRQEKYQPGTSRRLHQRKKGTLMGLRLRRGGRHYPGLRRCRAG